MLKIEVPGQEWWDEGKAEFCYIEPVTLQLEHSLISLSKWESKWKVPFYGPEPKTEEQMRDYVRCMTVTKRVDPAVYDRLSRENLDAIHLYMEDPMTATWFTGEPKPSDWNKPAANQNGVKKPPLKRRGGKTMTSEVLYARMFEAGVPLECAKWHLNRLMTLIRVIQEDQTPPKKMSRKEVMARQKALNKQRRGTSQSR